MFVAMSRFVVRNGMEEEVAQAFANRPHLVDDEPGFIRMPKGHPEEFWLLTWWEDEVCFDQWHKGHSYTGSHAGIPRGLKLVPGEQKIMRMEIIAN